MLNVKLFEHFSTRYFVFLGDFLKITKLNRNKKTEGLGTKRKPAAGEKIRGFSKPSPLKNPEKSKKGGVG